MTDFAIEKAFDEVLTEPTRLEPALKLFDAADSLLTAWEKWNDHRDLPKVRKEIANVQRLLDACKSLTLN